MTIAGTPKDWPLTTTTSDSTNSLLAQDPTESVTSTTADPLDAILPRIKFSCKNRSEAYYSDLDFCDIFHYCKVSLGVHPFVDLLMVTQTLPVEWLQVYLSLSERFILQ